MELSELRIGNYVQEHFTGEQIVSGIVDVNASGYGFLYLREPGKKQSVKVYMNHIKPIKLTNEWLIRLGWMEVRRSSCREFLDKLNTYDIVVGPVNYQKGLEKFDKVIFYVHQYQNIYYELTGNDLKIKEA